MIRYFVFIVSTNAFFFVSGRPLELQTTLYPSTADDANQHYVCLTLVLKFSASYPDEMPLVELKNPRGLGEDFIGKVLKKCHEKCSYFSGSPVIYEIIEVIILKYFSIIISSDCLNFAATS